VREENGLAPDATSFVDANENPGIDRDFGKIVRTSILASELSVRAVHALMPMIPHHVGANHHLIYTHTMQCARHALRHRGLGHEASNPAWRMQCITHWFGLRSSSARAKGATPNLVIICFAWLWFHIFLWHLLLPFSFFSLFFVFCFLTTVVCMIN
jgi:hypothetical protein